MNKFLLCKANAAPSNTGASSCITDSLKNNFLNGAKSCCVLTKELCHLMLRISERGSCNESCVTCTLDENEVIGIEAERVSDISEVADKETTIPAIKMEPD